jgi:hypothetical protein
VWSLREFVLLLGLIMQNRLPANSCDKTCEGVTLVAPATGVAPDAWPGLLRPSRHSGEAPVIFRRREGQRRAVPLLLCNFLKIKPEAKTFPAGIGFALS